MTLEQRQSAPPSAQFTGTRSDLAAVLTRGYLLMVPTLGLYRFWQTTWKRRFYWQNTIIGGDPLEYTGRATQLLVGFLYALVFFLPIYVALLVLSTQQTAVTLIGYLVLGTVLWFLSGYAIYRARDFRLSRTLWRGVRFDQKGNAWRYAILRFFWSLLAAITLGLAYPFMAASLWRYRYTHTWYGDVQFRFSGTWRTVAGPYYRAYMLCAVPVVASIILLFSGNGLILLEGKPILSPSLIALGVSGAVLFSLSIFYYRARETSRMFSAVSAAAATLRVHVKARSLLGQYTVYSLALFGASLLLVGVGGFIAGDFGPISLNLAALPDLPGGITPGQVAALLLFGGYLVFFTVFSLLGEIFLGCGFWILVCRNTAIANIESLSAARASGEDPSVIGEGLADALNVGAY